MRGRADRRAARDDLDARLADYIEARRYDDPEWSYYEEDPLPALDASLDEDYEAWLRDQSQRTITANGGDTWQVRR